MALSPIRRLMPMLHAVEGVSAVEFALIAPIMITLFIGGTEVTQGITIKRKVTIATRTIADLVAQDNSINNAEMNLIFAATDSVLAPYSGSKLKMVISSVEIDNNGAAKVAWSDANNGATPRAINSSITLPPGTDADGNQVPSLGMKNATLIMAEANYTYTPTIGYVVSGPIDLKDKLYLRPRLVNKICRNTGAQTLGCS